MSDTNPRSVLTIGHSALSYEDFVSLLRNAGATAVADVRSAPYSGHFPHFNGESLRDKLRNDNIAYVFLGKELGGRPKDRKLFHDGVADYERMAMAAAFKEGLDRVVGGASRRRIALMCSEHDPLDCHRCLLIGRMLAERNVSVNHILADGRQVSQQQIEEKLLSMSGRTADDLFLPREERLALAYRNRARKVAFAAPRSSRRSSIAAE
jgi:uncharacterized protein (DUF488 family)